MVELIKVMRSFFICELITKIQAYRKIGINKAKTTIIYMDGVCATFVILFIKSNWLVMYRVTILFQRVSFKNNYYWTAGQLYDSNSFEPYFYIFTNIKWVSTLKK
jgi:hypothetical protein